MRKTPSSVPVAPVAPNRVGHSATGGTGNGKLVLEPEYEAAIQRAIAEGLLDE